MKNKEPVSHSLRNGRVSLQNQIYLVTFVTADRKHRFSDFQCARLMIRRLKKARHTKTLAFVIMPDHVHWLLQLQDETPLSRVLQTTKSVSAHQLNLHLKRHGKFWQDGFHDHAIRKEESVIDAARYIIANPLRAGLVSNVRNYPHWDAVWL
jgi:putative transposase